MKTAIFENEPSLFAADIEDDDEQNIETRDVEVVKLTRHVTCDSVEQQRDAEKRTLLGEPIKENSPHGGLSGFLY